METDFIIASLFNLVINVIYTIVSLSIGILAFKIIDKRVLKSVNMEEELKNNNIAAAIFSATILIFVAISVALGLKG